MGYQYNDEERLQWLKSVCPEFKDQNWHTDLVYDPTDLLYFSFFKEGKTSSEKIDPSKIIGIEYGFAYNCPSLRSFGGDSGIINWMELFLMLRRLDYVINNFKDREQLTDHIRNNPSIKTVWKFGDHFFYDPSPTSSLFGQDDRVKRSRSQYSSL